MKSYIVTRAIRGWQYLSVEVKSKKEAREKVLRFDESVDGIDFDVDYYGRVTRIIEDKPDLKIKES